MRKLRQAWVAWASAVVGTDISQPKCTPTQFRHILQQIPALESEGWGRSRKRLSAYAIDDGDDEGNETCLTRKERRRAAQRQESGCEKPNCRFHREAAYIPRGIDKFPYQTGGSSCCGLRSRAAAQFAPKEKSASAQPLHAMYIFPNTPTHRSKHSSPSHIKHRQST